MKTYDDILINKQIPDRLDESAINVKQPAFRTKFNVLNVLLFQYSWKFNKGQFSIQAT